MHYSKYPYPDPAWYTKDNRKVSDYRVKSVPTKESWKTWFPDKPYKPLRVLVVGCGTCEAIMVAATNPDNRVVGIDVSKASIDVAKDLAIAEGIKNLTLYHSSLFDWWHGVSLFDIVIASGIMHHIVNVMPFLDRLRLLTADDGRLVVMVYGSYLRSFIPGFCQALIKLGLTANDEGVACTKAIIEALPEHHPVKEFCAAIANSDSQLTDMWLNAYFKQYSASELISTVEPHGYLLERWLSDSVDNTIIHGLPTNLRERFARLSSYDRWDICQVLNHNDLQLTALFAAR